MDFLAPLVLVERTCFQNSISALARWIKSVANSRHRLNQNTRQFDQCKDTLNCQWGFRFWASQSWDFRLLVVGFFSFVVHLVCQSNLVARRSSQDWIDNILTKTIRPDDTLAKLIDNSLRSRAEFGCNLFRNRESTMCIAGRENNKFVTPSTSLVGVCYRCVIDRHTLMLRANRNSSSLSSSSLSDKRKDH